MFDIMVFLSHLSLAFGLGYFRYQPVFSPFWFIYDVTWILHLPAAHIRKSRNCVIYLIHDIY